MEAAGYIRSSRRRSRQQPRQDFDVTSDRPIVASDKPWPVVDFDSPRGQTDR
jgi:hypothetical protein